MADVIKEYVLPIAVPILLMVIAGVGSTLFYMNQRLDHVEARQDSSKAYIERINMQTEIQKDHEMRLRVLEKGCSK